MRDCEIIKGMTSNEFILFLDVLELFSNLGKVIREL
jgi:general stress protein CsbA